MAETKKKTTKKKSIVESIVDEAKEIGEDALEAVDDVVEDVVEGTKSLIEGDEPKETKKKTTKKTTKKKSKLEELKEKAKALEGSLEEESTSQLKKKIKPEGETEDTLIPIEDYLKASIHLGTKVITPDMRPYVYKRRADGLAVFNTSLLDEEIRKGSEFLNEKSPEDIVLICKREAGWRAVELFGEITGIKTFTKKYPAGIMTNPGLSDFLETELVFIIDPWLDKNALADANNIGVPVLSICDTNNYTKGISQVIPGNNKSAKSIGMILYLLARNYVEKHKIDKEIPPISRWIDDWDNLIPPK